MTRQTVAPSVRDEVLRRDRVCIAFRADPSHVCRDTWGVPHRPDDVGKLTLDHVKQDLMMGRRAPSDAAHMVAACCAINVGVPSKGLRAIERAYLAELYPDVWR